LSRPELKGVVWLLAKGYAPDEGGLETYSRAVALAYQGLGYEVWVLTQTTAGPRWFVEPDHSQVQVRDVGSGSQPIVFLRALIAMVHELLRRGPPIVVHATTWRMAVVPWLLRIHPLVVSVHGREIAYPSGLLYQLMKAVLTRASRILAVSEATADLTRRRHPAIESRIVVAWNGISDWLNPAPHLRTVEQGASEILSLCRLVARKNIARALDAFMQVESTVPDISYTIAGRGPEIDALRQRAADTATKERIAIPGFVGLRGADELYRNAQIFLHPQVAEGGGRDIEGFGIAVADAMACGMAVVVGEAGGPAELVRHGETGLIVDGSSTAAVANALALLVKDPALTFEMGQRAASFAEANFSWLKHCSAALEGLPLRGRR
jgi:phosphatidyl-myo-inositol dimannoside synthase